MKDLVIWSLPSRNTRKIDVHNAVNDAELFESDSTFVCVADDGFVRKFSARTGSKLNEVKLSEKKLDALSVSPDGKRIVICSYYDDKVWVLDAESLKIESSISNQPKVFEVAFNSDNHIVLANDKGVAQVDWRTAEPNKKIEWELPINCDLASKADRLAYFKDGMLCVLDFNKEPIVYEYPFPKLTGPLASGRIAISSEGEKVAFAPSDQSGLIFFKFVDGKLSKCFSEIQTERICSISFTSSDESVVAGTWTKTIHWFDFETGQERLSMEHNHPLHAVATANSMNWVVACAGIKYPGNTGSILLWRLADAE